MEIPLRCTLINDEFYSGSERADREHVPELVWPTFRIPYSYGTAPMTERERWRLKMVNEGRERKPDRTDDEGQVFEVWGQKTP